MGVCDFVYTTSLCVCVYVCLCVCVCTCVCVCVRVCCVSQLAFLISHVSRVFLAQNRPRVRTQPRSGVCFFFATFSHLIPFASVVLHLAHSLSFSLYISGLA